MWYRRGKRGAWREGGRKEERGREGGVGGPGCSGRREEEEEEEEEDSVCLVVGVRSGWQPLFPSRQFRASPRPALVRNLLTEH